MSVDPREFRNALGNFATGVTIVTTMSEDREPVGLTANSFSSVSLDPPLVLFCLDRGSYSFAHFQASTHFVVNILSAEQKDISNHFAKAAVDKWHDVSFDICGVGCPAFSDALAVFECETQDIHEAGDHIIIIGKVESFRRRDDGEPLLYFRGRYGRIGAEAS